MGEQEIQTIVLLIFGGLFSMLWWFYRNEGRQRDKELTDHLADFLAYRADVDRRFEFRQRERDMLRERLEKLTGDWRQEHVELKGKVTQIDIYAIDTRERQKDIAGRLRQVEQDAAILSEQLKLDRRRYNPKNPQEEEPK